MLAVSIGEGHLTVGDRRDPMVRDRDAVRVASEVVEDGRGSTERRLRIHDPGLPSEDTEPRIELGNTDASHAAKDPVFRSLWDLAAFVTTQVDRL